LLFLASEAIPATWINRLSLLEAAIQKSSVSTQIEREPLKTNGDLKGTTEAISGRPDADLAGQSEGE
jgi:hypothetical protein